MVEKLTELPKVGDRIPVEKFHVSRMNVRYGEPFGDNEEDKILVANLSNGKIIQPFKARSEGDGYGVVFGGRRFLAKREAGAKYFVVGVDCLIEEMTDQEAREASLIENLFRKDINPLVRAKTLNQIIMEREESLRATAQRLGIPASSLCDWLKVLELSPKMQNALANERISFTDGLKVARMNVDIELQDKLTEVLEIQGVEAFEEELETIKEAAEPIRKEGRAKHASSKKLAKGDVLPGSVYWKKLRESLKEFADIFSDYCTLEEWEDEANYHLKLEVVMPKDLTKSEDTPDDGLETLSADEAPQICGSCGKDILEGDPFVEDEGLYYCRRCASKTSLEI